MDGRKREAWLITGPLLFANFRRSFGEICGHFYFCKSGHGRFFGDFLADFGGPSTDENGQKPTFSGQKPTFVDESGHGKT